MTAYDLACSKERLLLRPGESQTFDLTVSNAAERDSTCLCHIEVIDRPPPEAITTKRRSKDAGRPALEWTYTKQRDLAAGQTAAWTVRVSTTRDVDPGDYRAQILLADEDNPDEHYSLLKLPMIVMPAGAKRRFNWPLWICATLVLLLAAALVSVVLSGGSEQVPQLVGLTQDEAEEQLMDAGLEMELVETSFEDLDGPMMAELWETRESLLMEQAAKGNRDAKKMLYRLGRLDKADVDAAPPVVRDDLVWRQTDVRELESGEPLKISMAPPVVKVPDLDGVDALEAGRQLAEVGLRFAISEESNADAGYGPGLEPGKVWGTRPSSITEWEEFWPADILNPDEDEEVEEESEEGDTDNEGEQDDAEKAVEDAEETSGDKKEETDTDAATRESGFRLYRGYRLTLLVNPETISVPEFVGADIDAVLSDAQYQSLNIKFALNNRKMNRARVLKLQTGLQASGKSLAIYRQNHVAGSQLAPYPHEILLSITSVKSGQ